MGQLSYLSDRIHVVNLNRGSVQNQLFNRLFR